MRNTILQELHAEYEQRQQQNQREENIRRMQADHRDSARIRRAIATSRSAYDDLPYARIDVTGLSLSQTAEQILRLL